MKIIKPYEELDFTNYKIGNLYKLYIDGHDKEKNIDVSGLVFIVKLEVKRFGGSYGRISGICVSPDEYKGRYMPIRGEELVKLSEPSEKEVEEYHFLMNTRKYNL